MNNWENIDHFLNTVAETLDYNRESLSIVAELRSSGPTVSPGGANPSDIVATVTASPSTSLPAADYDTLKNNHIDYQVRQGSRDLFSFQHSVFFGNCGLCIHRWVRVLDDMNPWDTDLVKESLRFRAQLARNAMYGVLVISTGNSFSGAEPLDAYETVFSGTGRGPVSLRVLDLRKYLA